MADTVKGAHVVLYIGGEGRSGSTVLSTMLGNNTGFFPVGELRGIWQALRLDELCGCGELFSVCPFWADVGRRAFGGWAHVDLQASLAADAALARHRHIGKVALARARWRRDPDVDEHLQRLAALYQAVAEVSGSDVIVDSTKDPAYAFLLRGVAEVDLRVVHLVRDSRGVAYSWMKQNVERPEYAEHATLRGSFMLSRTPWRAAMEWSVKNALFHLMRRTPRVVVRYEQLMAAPGPELLRMQELAGRGSWTPEQLDTQFEARPFHSLGGNRVRFQRGHLRADVDDEWRRRMRCRDKILVSALTLPLLTAYGYLLRRKST